MNRLKANFAVMRRREWRASSRKTEMILLDINLPKLNGFEVARRVREHIPQLKIIIFSADRSFDLAEEALRLGAYGYLVKSDAGTELYLRLKRLSKESGMSVRVWYVALYASLNHQPLRVVICTEWHTNVDSGSCQWLRVNHNPPPTKRTRSCILVTPRPRSCMAAATSNPLPKSLTVS